MKVLITGCAGYLGSALTTYLVDKFPNWEIVGIDRMIYGQAPLNHLIEYKNFTFYRCDVRKIEELPSDACTGFDVIFPFAALVGMPICKDKIIEAYSVNTHSLDILFRLNPKAKYIFPTTNSGYGVGETDASGGLKYCTEETPLNPISAYGKSKVLAEKAILERGGVALRLATVHGLSPRPRLDLLVNDFTFRAIRYGNLSLYEPHFKRNYIHIKDVIDAMLYCYGNYESMRGQVYNLGSEENLSKLELAQIINTTLQDEGYGKEIKITLEDGRDPDQRNYIVSNDKIHKAGFKPIFFVTDTIRDMYRNYDYLDYLYNEVAYTNEHINYLVNYGRI